MSRPRTLIVIAVAIALASVLVVGSSRNAGAAFPGRNGTIAFESKRAGGFHIYAMGADGAHTRALTRGAGHEDEDAAFSPNGRRIAFDRTSGRGHDQVDVYLMRADGSHVRRLTNHRAVDHHPTFSPNGRRIAFIVTSRSGESDDIYAMRTDGRHVHRITHSPGNHYSNPGGLAFSPDGERIAFGFEAGRHFRICDMKTDGSHRRRLIGGNRSPQEPAYSPNGEKIAFQTFRRNGIYVMRADGTHVRRLTHHLPGGVDSGPAFSPDGGEITFARSSADRDFGHPEIYSMKADGTQLRRLTNNRAYDRSPDWGVRR